MKKAVAVLTLLLVLMTSACLRSKGPSSGAANLTFYGLDNSDAFDSAIAEFQSKNPGVTIKYKKFNAPASFEEIIVNQIAEGEGPDIFYLHNTWLPRHLKKLVPLTSESLTPKAFSEVFVGVASDDFVQPNPATGNAAIYALPLYVDTLALYYNKNDYERNVPEKGKPAGGWDEFKNDTEKFKVVGSDGLRKGAVALGRADNIHLAADILYNLFLQGGVDFYDPDYKRVQITNKGQEFFDYFLSFAKSSSQNYSWDELLAPASAPLQEVEAFLSGKVSSILAYSDLYPRLETEVKNVRSRTGSSISISDVAVAPVPQIAQEQANFKAFASYYGLGVSRNSKNSLAAWNFVQFLTSQEKSRAYLAKMKRPTARRDLIEEQKKQPILDVFAQQLGYAGSFRIFSDTQFGALLKEAITAANKGQVSRQAFAAAEQKMNEILSVQAPDGLYPKKQSK